MNSTIKKIGYSIREICNGSPSVNILTICGLTALCYLILTYLSSDGLLGFLTGIYNQKTYSSTEEFLTHLEVQKIDEITAILPGIVSAIFFIRPSRQIKSNIQNRLLPIPVWARMLAIMLLILLVFMISTATIILLDQAIIAYIKHQYLPEVTKLRQSIGDLYYQLSNYSMLSDHYRSPLSGSSLLTPLVFTYITSLLLLDLTLIFKKYSQIFGPVLIAAVFLTGSMLHRLILNAHLPHVMYIHNIWSIALCITVLLLCLIAVLYYSLKEREE